VETWREIDEALETGRVEEPTTGGEDLEEATFRHPWADE